MAIDRPGESGPAGAAPQQSAGRRARRFLKREEEQSSGEETQSRRCGGRSGPQGPGLRPDQPTRETARVAWSGAMSLVELGTAPARTRSAAKG